MRSFARLYRALDASSRSGPKLAALASYFSQAPQADAAWALWLLCGERLAQPVPTRVLKAAAMHACDLDAALFAVSVGVERKAVSDKARELAATPEKIPAALAAMAAEALNKLDAATQ